MTAGAAATDPERVGESPAVQSAVHAETKDTLWVEWLERTLQQDIHDPDCPDPLPLFETDASGEVKLTDNGVLKRHPAVDRQIRSKGKHCVDSDGVAEGPEGLLYLLYQLDADAPDTADIVPRYIGKAEASGKQTEVSANFTEIVNDRDATRSFARWGDGDY